MDLSKIREEHSIGLIDYKWKVRNYLYDYKGKIDKNHKELIKMVVSPFIYVDKNRQKIQGDKSLTAVCQVCVAVKHAVDVDVKDDKLKTLAQLFNTLIKSDRALLMCYDCGTVARSLFLQLIEMYRGHFMISDSEISLIRSEYYMNKHGGTDGIKILRSRINLIKKNCLFLCAMQLGENFGHIYVIEKNYVNSQSVPRYRIYQSCLNAYLLIDYIESMDYCGDIKKGVDINGHLLALEHLFSTPKWSDEDISLFIKWFKFYPESGPCADEVKLFTSTYVIL